MNWFWLIVSSLVRFLLFGFSLLNDSTGLWYFVDVETETYRDWEIYWISRPRLIETERFLGCRDRDSSRLRNFLDVETETHRDWENQWMSRPRPVETGPKMSIPRLHRDSRSSLVHTSGGCFCKQEVPCSSSILQQVPRQEIVSERYILPEAVTSYQRISCFPPDPLISMTLFKLATDGCYKD